MTTTTPRADHLAWCKKRALAELAHGGPEAGFASMASDLSKHPDTEKHAGLEIGMMMLMSGHLSTHDQMKRFIEGFN